MRSPLARISRARFAVCAAACLVVLLAPARSFATHWIVDQSGGGDFTTIQAAIDNQLLIFRDTIFVMPGDYAEALGLPELSPQTFVVGVGGALATSTRSVSVPYWGDHDQTRFEGLTFTHPVTVMAGDSFTYFARCVFLAQVHASGDGSGAPNFDDCDFHDRLDLGTYSFGYMHSFKNLRFHSAPLFVYTNANEGPIFFEDCSFEGPADTLVHARVSYDEISFENCRFANAKTGIVFDSLSDGASAVSRCKFVDLSDTGIKLDGTSGWSGSRPGITVLDSRFERCGTAVWWIARGELGSSRATLLRDTVLASTSDGVVLGRADAGGIYSTIVDGSGGIGVRYLLDVVDAYLPAVATLSGSTIRNSLGDGVCVECSGDVAPLPWWRACRATLGDCMFVNNGGAGLKIEEAQWSVRGCVSIDNGGDGFLLAGDIGQERQLILNTSVLNGGDGFRFEGAAVPGDSLRLVQRNLAVMNAGVGFRVPPFSTGALAFNDAWSNTQGQYAGVASPTDSNLTLDPQFCDMVAEFAGLGLQSGSPCGAFGVYGLIGARAGACGSVTNAPSHIARASFAVRPSVAHGIVEFVPPSIGPDGRVEIFDVTGRRHWGAAFGPTTGPLRWKGQSDTGHARPGLYWVRFTRAGETQSQRLVWLR